MPARGRVITLAWKLVLAWVPEEGEPAHPIAPPPEEGAVPVPPIYVEAPHPSHPIEEPPAEEPPAPSPY